MTQESNGAKVDDGLEVEAPRQICDLCKGEDELQGRRQLKVASFCAQHKRRCLDEVPEQEVASCSRRLTAQLRRMRNNGAAKSAPGFHYN